MQSGQKISLIEAVKKNDVDQIRALLEAKADVEERDKNSYYPSQRTVLQIALENNHMGTIRLLLNAKANVNAVDAFRMTTLFYAQNAEVTQLLLEAKANTEMKDGTTRTTLLRAIERCNHGYIGVDVIKVLLDGKADVLAKDVQDQTAVTLAKRPEILTLLNAHISQMRRKGFLLGLHPYAGAASPILTMSRQGLFDPQVLRMVFACSGDNVPLKTAAKPAGSKRKRS